MQKILLGNIWKIIDTRENFIEGNRLPPYFSGQDRCDCNLEKRQYRCTYTVYLICNDGWSVYEHNGYDMIFQGIFSECHGIFHVKGNWLSEQHIMKTVRGLKKEIPYVMLQNTQKQSAPCRPRDLPSFPQVLSEENCGSGNGDRAALPQYETACPAWWILLLSVPCSYHLQNWKADPLQPCPPSPAKISQHIS